MIELVRTVRFCVNPFSGMGLGDVIRPQNGFGGWPSMAGLGAYYELEVRCRGEADPCTGYLMNISEIDREVREHAITIIARNVADNPRRQPGQVLAEVLPALQPALRGAVASLRWQLTPYYAVAMHASTPDRAVISQQFEFAASHRLNCEHLTEAENIAIFGKCNNPNGHGHNYRLEPAVSVPLHAPPGGTPLTLQRLEAIVDQVVIQRFDHKHLNLDVSDFANLNPSVENIAKVCYDLLTEPIAQAGGKLEAVTVWETEKTRCTYPAYPAPV